MRKLTTETFISRAIAIHGNRYDYSKSIYTSATARIEIICSVHGSFMQKSSHHTTGFGCKKCADKERGMRNRISFEEFVRKSRIVHGDIYQYYNQENLSSTSKVKIRCEKHGVFHQTADIHMSGSGCNLCGNEVTSLKSRISKEDFLSRSKSVHGSRYIYDDDMVVNRAIDPVKIICRLHGAFYQPARHHYEGNGCSKCGYVSAIRKKKRSYGFHGHSRSKYVSIADQNHGGMSSIYLISAHGNGESFWKVGISMNGISHRFASHFPYDIGYRLEVSMPAGDAWDLEKKIHKVLKKLSYRPKILFQGYTECFSEVTEEARKMIEG